MKRSKNDHIRSTISRYFKRRQFTEGEMPSRKDVRHKQAITDLSVRSQARSRSSVENTLALTSISRDATAFDQQFTRLNVFIMNAADPYKGQLQPLLFPMFANIYLEMLCNGQKVAAHKFHERHCDMFQAMQHQPLLKLLKKLETKSEVLTNKSVAALRDNCTVLTAGQDTFDYLMRFLKTEDNMIILQVFNQYIQTNVTSSLSNGKIELSAMPEEKEADPSMAAPETASNSQDKIGEVDRAQARQHTLEEELASAIKEMHDLPPSLPSICFFTFLNTYQGLCSATLSPDKKRLGGSFEDGSISVWSLEPDTFVRSPTECDPSKIVLSADFIHCTEQEIREKMNHRAIQSTERINLQGHRGAVYKTRFLRDSSPYLLSCSEDCTVRLWDMAPQTNRVIYKGHTSPVWDVNISCADSLFASCSHDTTAKLWTFDRTYPLRSYIGHSMDVDCIEFHPNSSYLATGSADKTVRLWSVTEARTVRLFQGHRGSVLALAFSPNGKLLASAGEDRRIRVWDLGSGHVIKELRGHSDIVYSLAFDENSHMLASGGADCCIRLWDISRTSDSITSEGHSSAELLGAFPTKSALISYLSFSQHNVLLASGASS
ncbi:taf5-like RNA polymerase ii p300/cbp-associated factor-associated factor 65 kda subunit 5l [Plakobranchus ocellatus]|uniref:Taf5-like RNA polymerase ii p300/cbp-associated factor-associated factor 65 kDa subunit 5l n=1 Tax=Plakobranchus ocellatus TaxID=259542 RepID=A0AAV4DPE7_9GAST|nr:taf5-like RNA polymerase ii p300/cbp-associated factor-associated factor 65 kda subunit 5l [Plakobranchus ocellatus]